MLIIDVCLLTAFVSLVSAILIIACSTPARLTESEDECSTKSKMGKSLSRGKTLGEKPLEEKAQKAQTKQSNPDVNAQKQERGHHEDSKSEKMKVDPELESKKEVPPAEIPPAAAPPVLFENPGQQEDATDLEDDSVIIVNGRKVKTPSKKSKKVKKNKKKGKSIPSGQNTAINLKQQNLQNNEMKPL